MRLPTIPGVVGISGVDPKRLTDLLSQIAVQLNGISEGTVAAVTNAMTAAPTTGTWAQGDFITNTAPTGATPTIGWICTVGGTPGTWVAVTVGGGGAGTVTNTGTLTANQVVVGNGSADVKTLAAGTNGFVLSMIAGIPAWTTAPTSGITRGDLNFALQQPQFL